MRVGHIELPVRDPLESLAFYTQTLGFELVANQGDQFIWVALGDTEILLKPGDANVAELSAATCIVLYSNALEERAAELRGRGLELTGGPPCYHLRDPDGHWFQLVDPEGDHSEGEG